MNLHSIVRGAINTVNPDMAATWQQSTGYSTSASGKRTPSFSSTDVQVNVQALTASDLRHQDLQNIEGVKRGVYMFGNGQGVVRVDEKGGDLLLFPQVRGGPVYTWKVVAVLETWTPDIAGWCKLAVVLQNDPPA